MDGSIFPGWQCQRRTLRYRPYEVTIPLSWASEGDRAPQFKQRILLFLRWHLTVQHGSGQSLVMKRMFCFCFLFFVCVFLSFHNRWMLNTLRPRQNGGRFADDILDCVLLNENVWISIKISLKFLPKGPINNIPALVPIMTLRRPGDKPLSEPMMMSLLTHISTTRPQWVRDMNCHFFSSLHDIFPSCAHVQVVYVFISIVQSIFLSIISPFCHWWPLRPQTQLIEHCHVKQLGDIFESKITHKLSLLHYTKTSY